MEINKGYDTGILKTDDATRLWNDAAFQIITDAVRLGNDGARSYWLDANGFRRSNEEIMIKINEVTIGFAEKLR